MKTRLILALATACACWACGQAQQASPPVETPSAIAEETIVADSPGASDRLMPDDPDLRSKVEKLMLGVKVAGVPVYLQVSEDFPEEFAGLIDAMTSAIRAGKPQQEIALEGGRFNGKLIEKYASHMADAGPATVRDLMALRLEAMRRLREVSGVEACDRAAIDNNFSNVDISGILPEVTSVLMATWSAMKAGLDNPRPQDPPTAADRQLLAQAALADGASPELIDTWFRGGLAPDGRLCELGLALQAAALTMQGPAAERIQASATIMLPR